ncbi:hypothetical protein [Zoogloea sp.]|uniref:hypothetical protein n=1 Tax=Zoogloea sp. TaxID=49181 RepID=UPI001D247E0E|nr:hypothetical protein [Zoogloea sp.]MBK6653249.1 hypothetical protein [Zoogloea sp.]
MTLQRIIALLVAGILLAGCASSTLRSTWRDETDLGTTPRKLVVFVSVKDDNLRRMAENRVLQSIPPGTSATAGHTLNLDPKLETEEVRARLKEQGFDAALLSRLVSVDKSQTVVPAQTQYAYDPMFRRFGPRFGSFYSFYPYVYTTPAYTVDNTTVVVETLLYRLPEGKPVWTAVSETLNPRSSAQVVEELITLVGGKLKSEGLLPSR